MKHDTFAENILTLVAENAARLGLTGGEGLLRTMINH